jgi:hypothetical protein
VATGSLSPPPDLFAEGLRAALSAPAADGTLLQRCVPGSGMPLEAVEGTAALPSVANGKQKRQAQNRRYRARRKHQPQREIVSLSAARVIPRKFFFMLL